MAPDKGRLVKPTLFAVDTVANSCLSVTELSKPSELLRMPNQSHVVANIIVVLLASDDTSGFDTCEDAHTTELVLEYVVWYDTNIFQKHFCRN